MLDAIPLISCTSQGFIDTRVPETVWSMKTASVDKLSKYNLQEDISVIMTRSFMDTLGQPIVNSQNLVVSTSMNLKRQGFEIYQSVDDAISNSKSSNPFIAGGMALYQQSIGKSKYIFISYNENILHKESNKIDLNKIFNEYKLCDKFLLKSELQFKHIIPIQVFEKKISSDD